MQPAASAGAIFHVDSIKGVFHGVITPTGPMGLRDVTLICPGPYSDCPSRAVGARSAKNWKFSAADVKERAYWDDYMLAYEAALNATSRPWAPWYAIPADNKPYMRARVAGIIIDALQSIGLEYPEPSDEDRAEFEQVRKEIE
mgnify:CR=1 FL=1